jgi:hypothetical protein
MKEKAEIIWWTGHGQKYKGERAKQRRESNK